jgi:hypothetical protein
VEYGEDGGGDGGGDSGGDDDDGETMLMVMGVLRGISPGGLRLGGLNGCGWVSTASIYIITVKV